MTLYGGQQCRDKPYLIQSMEIDDTRINTTFNEEHGASEHGKEHWKTTTTKQEKNIRTNDFIIIFVKVFFLSCLLVAGEASK